MKIARGSVVVDCAPAAFWQIYTNEAYLRALYLETLGYLSLDVLERSEDATKIRIVPKLNLPGPLQKLFGDRFVYENHGRRQGDTWTWQMVPPRLDGKEPKSLITTRGTIRIEPVGTTQCRRHDEVFLESKIFGLGGLIESTAEKETRTAQEKEYALLARFAKDAAPSRGPTG